MPFVEILGNLKIINLYSRLSKLSLLFQDLCTFLEILALESDKNHKGVVLH